MSKGEYSYYDLGALEGAGLCDVSTLPFSIRVLLETLFVTPMSVRYRRRCASRGVLVAICDSPKEFPYMPGRVALQDFTGVPVVSILPLCGDAVAYKGGDPGIINPVVHSDLVIDHSVQVDYFA